MEVVESFVVGKAADPSLCEDAVVVTKHHAAVVDGATDISGRLYEGMAGGRWATQACLCVIREFPADIDAHAAVAAMTLELDRRLDPGLPAADRPCASVTVYSAAHREIWQIGDVGFAYRNLAAAVGQPRKLVDQIAADFRAAVVAAAAAAGAIDLYGPAHPDPGRSAAQALISRQGALRNTTGPYAYAGIDGRPVPGELVVVHPVPEEITELVIASDGYPEIGPSLAESEAALARLLAVDPWCVRELAGTKGLMPGQASYDDRAYLRIRIAPRRP